MKAAVFYGQRDVRVDEVPEPEVENGSLKVKVDWCGICGTDMHEYLAGPIFAPAPGEPHPLTGDEMPITLGHEFAGEVVEVGEGVEVAAVGDRVAIDPVYRCGECPECRGGAPNLCQQLGFYGLSGGGGGLAEYAVVPAYMAHQLPEVLTSEQGALVEPIAVGLRAVRRAGFREGQSAVVFGGGPIGAAVVQCLRAHGAGLVAVAEVTETRKRIAHEIGADVVIDPREEAVVERLGELTDGVGPDVSFDAAGLEETFQAALKATRKGGMLVNVAIWEGPIEVDLNDVVLGEITVSGTIAYSDEDFADTIAMIRDGRVQAGEIVTGRVPLNNVVEGGLEELVNNKDQHVKILVQTSV